MTDDSPRALSDARASVLGFAAGTLNGLIAIGGGIVITPGLVVYGRASPEVAVGTSLAAVAVLSSVAFLMHASFGGLGLSVYGIAAVVIAGMVGAQVGAWMLSRLTASWMLFLFSAFLVVMSVRLLVQALGMDVGLDMGLDMDIGAAPGAWAGALPWWSYPVIGFLSGILSGVFGVGGGALVLLGFVVLFGMPVREGMPLALLVNVTNALAGCVRHSRAGRVLWREVRRMVPAALVGIAIGTAVAISLPPDALRLVFGGFFLFMSGHVARQAYRRRQIGR